MKLPITERTGVPFASEHPNLMHSCGHDVHASIFNGVDSICSKCLTPTKHFCCFFFSQPKKVKGGAKSILAEGIIQKFEIASVFALHIASELPVGSVSAKEGIFFAVSQEFDVLFYGKTSHIAFRKKRN